MPKTLSFRQSMIACCAAALLFVPLATLAGPKEDIQTVATKFLAQRSYHVVMENSDKRVPKMEHDFAAPDRYRMQMPMGTQIVIGDTMYMNVGGRSMRVPMPSGMLTQWRQSDQAFRSIAQTQVEALGGDSVNGKPAKKYRLTYTTNHAVSVMWVGNDNLPLKMEVTGSAGKQTNTVTLYYSRFNDPTIKIDAPK